MYSDAIVLHGLNASYLFHFVDFILIPLLCGLHLCFDDLMNVQKL